MAKTGSQVTFWGWETGADNDLILTTKDLVRLLHIPEDHHVGLWSVAIRSGSVDVDTFMAFDYGENRFFKGGYSIDGTTESKGAPPNTIFSKREDAIGDPGQYFYSFPEPLEVLNNIVLHRSASADIRFILTYKFLPGSMDWTTENLEWIPDIKKVGGPQTSAGNEYHQVGDTYQIGRREY